MGSRRGFFRTLLAGAAGAVAHFALVPQGRAAARAGDAPSNGARTLAETIRIEHRGRIVAEYQYDQLGRLVRVTQFADPSQPFSERMTTFAYAAQSHATE